ncbi:MAG: tetratricopeptide repeat protein, partial [Chlamydiae bacterium]|nr:tetratricopeptide repeat protein [Chlamydiota bacterium]
MDDHELEIATDYLNFMHDLKKIDHPSIQNFVLEFDQLFAANDHFQKGLTTKAYPSAPYPFPPFEKGQMEKFLERANFKVQESASSSQYFEFIREIVDVNVPIQITLQDLYRISEKGLQINLNEVHRLLDVGQKKEALDLLSILILYAPEYPHLWIIKGVLNYLDNQPKEAILSLLIALYHSPLALHSLIPLLYVLHQTNHSDYLPLKTWFHQHKEKSYTDYDTPKHFKEL